MEGNTSSWIPSGEVIDFAALISSGLGLVILVATGIYIAIQTNAVKRNLSFAALQMLYNANIRIGEIFITNPELRPYFYDNEALSADPSDTRSRVLATSEAILDLFESVVIQIRMHKNDQKFEPLKQHWYTYIKETFESSPALIDYFDQNVHWYAAELVELRNQCLVRE